MSVTLTTLIAEVQARCNALTSGSSISQVIDVAIAAKKVERAGGSIARATLDTELQRVVDLSGGGSQIEDLIALAAANENFASGLGYLPDYGALQAFAGKATSFTDINGAEWLKTGYLGSDFATYPNAPKCYLPGTSASSVTPPATIQALKYSELNSLWLAGSGSAIYSSSDHVSWVNRGGGAVTDFCELPSGRLIAVGGSTAYYHSTNATAWTSSSVQPIGLTKVVETIGGYWYGINSTQSGYGKENSAITQVTMAAGSAWAGIAYSKKLKILVAVGTNLAASNASPYAGSWVLRTIPSGTYRDCVWHEHAELFIAAGDSGVISVSVDGINWVSLGSLGVSVSRLYYDKQTRRVFASGASGAFIYSDDGLSWTSISAGSNSGTALASKPGSGVLVGSSAMHFSQYIERFGVEVYSEQAPGLPNYVRTK